MKFTNKKAFTIVELIVVMAVIGILVLLAMPKFIGHTKEAKFTKLISNTKQLETASERYYMDHQEWPRLSDTSYTADEVEAFAQEVYDSTGRTITLDTEGQYYDIDYTKLSKYINIPDNKEHYIIQNPVGNIYGLEGLTEEAKNRIETPIPANNKPIAIITMNPNTNITASTNIIWSFENSTDPDGDSIINAEWEGKQDIYTVGTYTVRLRVQDSKGLWSDWASKTFTVVNPEVWDKQGLSELQQWAAFDGGGYNTYSNKGFTSDYWYYNVTGYYGLYKILPIIDRTKGFTFEVDAQVMNSTTNYGGGSSDCTIGIFDVNYSAAFGLKNNSINFVDGNTQVIDAITFNTMDKPHKYRITLKDNSAKFYIDGNLVKTITSLNTSPGFGMTPSVFVGDNAVNKYYTGSMYVYNVKYSNQGNFDLD